GRRRSRSGPRFKCRSAVGRPRLRAADVPGPLWPGSRRPAAAGLDPADRSAHNDGMEVQGRVHNGVVVLEGELPFPEGTPVTVLYRGAPASESTDVRRPVRLPLVRSDRPGSRRLTAERMTEILEDEDVPS